MDKIKGIVLTVLISIILRLTMCLLGVFVTIGGLIAPNHIYEGMKRAFNEMNEY